MTKKHFIELADKVARHNRYANELDTKFTTEQINVLASFCAEMNPRFNRQRWLDYIAGKCGPSGGKLKTLLEEGTQ